MTDETYYAGRDCTCAAFGESECGCSADWTDARIYKLQDHIAQLEQLLKIREERITDLEDELDTLRR